MKKESIGLCILTCLLLFQAKLFGQETDLKNHKNDTIPKATELDEVVLVDRKNAITYTNGITQVRVENSPLANLATPIDILSQLPSVLISPDRESFQVMGKGAPLIYLGNQRISMLELGALSVDAIKSIAIISNPSVKYEAEGRAVLLITLKKQREDGTQMNFSELVAFKRRVNNYAALQTAIKKKKLEFKGNFSYNQLQHWESNGSEFSLRDPDFEQQYLVKAIGDRLELIGGSGLYYQLKENSYLSTSFNLKTQRNQIPITTRTRQRQGGLTNNIASFSDGLGHRELFRSNMNFGRETAKTILFFGLQYAYYLNNLDNQIENQLDTSLPELAQIRDQDNRITNLTARFDLEIQLRDHWRLDVGSMISLAQSKAFSNFQFLENQSSAILNYRFKEENYASYVQVTSEGKKVSYFGGVRSEMTYVNAGFSSNIAPLIARKRLRLFPKAKINVAIDSTKNMTLNYATSIRRPRYRDAVAINTFINPFLDWTTNLKLLPTRLEELSLDFQYKKQGVSLSYTNIKNPVYIGVNYNENQNKLLLSQQNFEQETQWQLKFENQYYRSFWNISSTLSILWNKITDQKAALINRARPYLYYYCNNEFHIAPKTTFTIDFWGLTKQQKAAFEQNALFVIGASLSKTFFGNLTLTINASDIFRAMNFEDRYTLNTIDSRTTYFADGQQLSFAIKYSFGAIKKSSYKNKEVSDTPERL